MKGTGLQLLKRRWFLTSHMPLFSIAFSSFRAPQMALFTRHFAGCQRTSRVGIMRAMFYREFATTPHPSNINDSCCKHLFVALQPQILIFDRSKDDELPTPPPLTCTLGCHFTKWHSVAPEAVSRLAQWERFCDTSSVKRNIAEVRYYFRQYI